MALSRYHIHFCEHGRVGPYLTLKPAERISFRLDLVDCGGAVQDGNVSLAFSDPKLVHHRCSLKRMLAEQNLMGEGGSVDIFVPVSLALQQCKRRIKQRGHARGMR